MSLSVPSDCSVSDSVFLVPSDLVAFGDSPQTKAAPITEVT